MRSLLLNGKTNNILRNGALLIDVTIQVKVKEHDLYSLPKVHATNMLGLTESREKSGVSFHIGTNTFRLHSQILYTNAPILASLCERKLSILL
jgi:hypothetical protein